VASTLRDGERTVALHYDARLELSGEVIVPRSPSSRPLTAAVAANHQSSQADRRTHNIDIELVEDLILPDSRDVSVHPGDVAATWKARLDRGDASSRSALRHCTRLDAQPADG
jgi:hypothetical protein